MAMVIGVLTSGLGSSWRQPSSTSRASVGSPPCSGPCLAGPDLPADWTGPGGIVLFGEYHGTAELPAFFGGSVCRVAASGAHVQVGLELPRDELPSRELLVEGGAGPEGRLVVTSPSWRREFQDGRSSQAMARLLGWLGRLMGSGLPVDVFFIDLGAGADGQERDESMAARLIDEARAHPEALTMALVGNIHARTAVGLPWNPVAKPMGWFLREGACE